MHERAAAQPGSGLGRLIALGSARPHVMPNRNESEMTDLECTAHHLVARLRYLLSRLEDEFFHIHPHLDSNGSTTSLALSSILNEALNLQEAAFPGGASSFWDSIKKWGDSQDWKWSEVEIRFTRWPVLENLQPFHVDENGKLTILGRDSNNAVKHKGELATLRDTVNACAAGWFLVLEKAREAEIYFRDADIDELMSLFDCYELIGFLQHAYGTVVARPLVNRVENPAVRGRSEEPLAKATFERRYSRWKK